ncbi:hypothetical protein [Ferrimonas pelagia]|uniref:Uncharacterized protein n=1 Tax=Ferrimonas pelagia TaxID=1177826 RepID=A0ABP9E9B4_9GAMM
MNKWLGVCACLLLSAVVQAQQVTPLSDDEQTLILRVADQVVLQEGDKPGDARAVALDRAKQQGAQFSSRMLRALQQELPLEEGQWQLLNWAYLQVLESRDTPGVAMDGRAQLDLEVTFRQPKAALIHAVTLLQADERHQQRLTELAEEIGQLRHSLAQLQQQQPTAEVQQSSRDDEPDTVAAQREHLLQQLERSRMELRRAFGRKANSA